MSFFYKFNADDYNLLFYVKQVQLLLKFRLLMAVSGSFSSIIYTVEMKVVRVKKRIQFLKMFGR